MERNNETKAWRVFTRKTIPEIEQKNCSKRKAKIYLHKNPRNRWAWETYISRNDVSGKEAIFMVKESKIEVLWAWVFQKEKVSDFLKRAREKTIAKIVVTIGDANFYEKAKKIRSIDIELIKSFQKQDPQLVLF